MNPKFTRTALYACAVLLIAEAVMAVGLLTGCGSGTKAATSQTLLARGASAHFTIYWPTPTRVIPLAAGSVKITVELKDPITGQFSAAADPQTIPRPANSGTSSVEFKGLPVGQLRFTATAYPNADASGVEQATGMGELSSEDVSQTLEVPITMDSTVTRVQATPTAISIPKGTVTSITVTAYDSQNRVVLTAPSAWHWDSSTPSTVLTPTGGTVDGTTGQATVMGSVSGLNKGSATITIRYTEAPDGSSNTAQSVVTVTDTPAISACRNLPNSCDKPYPIKPQPCKYQCQNSAGQVENIDGFVNGCGFCIEEPK